MSEEFLVGQTVRIRFYFWDSSGILITDGISGIEVKAKKPSGNVVTITASSDAASNYFDLNSTEAGLWNIRITSQTPTPSATETSIRIVKSSVI